MDFATLIEMLRNPPEGGVPDTIYDDLSSSYNDVLSGASAKATEADTLVQSLNAEISRLKAMNFDLLTAVPSTDPDGDEGDDNNENDDDAESGGIDDLFTKEGN
jgi:hypothetical protein